MDREFQNNELLQHIIDASNLGLAVYKAIRNDAGEIVDFVHEFINQTTREALGQDFTGRLLSEHGPDGIKQVEHFKKVIETGKVNEYTLKAESGVVEGWFHFSNAPLGGDRLLHTWQDVTKQKNTELELQNSKKLFVSVLTSQHEALHSAVNGGSMNTALEPLVDITVSKIGRKARAAFYLAAQGGKGLHLAAGMNEEYAHDINSFEAGPELLAYTVTKHTGKPVITPDIEKEPHWQQFRNLASKHNYRGCWFFPVKVKGGPVLGIFAMYFSQPCEPSAEELETAVIIAHAAAIIISWHKELQQRIQAETALRKSEERMRATLESATDFAIITMDSDRNVVGWNTGAEYIFGYSEQEILGEPADKIFIPEDRQAGMPQKEQRQADKEGRANDERWHQRKDGSRLFLSGVMVPMRSNIFPGYVKIARDITDRKLQEQQKDEFIGIASHELKTPVTSIKAYAEIVLERLEELGDETNSSLVARLNTQIDRLTLLINDLLDTTKISEGQLKYSFEETDVNELLRDRLDTIKTTTDHKFVLELQKLRPVLADGERIGQVIINLLSNAIKYSPKGSIITVRTKDHRTHVEINIEDEGYGIPGKDLQKVFDKFFRVSSDNMHTFPGMGLGLYISAQIIQRHGGTISVKSEESKGSVFTVTLPYTR